MLGSVSAIREMNVTSVPAVSKEGGGKGGVTAILSQISNYI